MVRSNPAVGVVGGADVRRSTVAPRTPAAHPSRGARRSPTARRVAVFKVVVWAVCLWPVAWLGWATLTGSFGANPIEEIIHVMGRWALVLLLVTLAVTPVRRFTGWNGAVRFRRLLGLFAFFYLTLHLLAYAVLDQWLELPYIIEDVLERPYIAVGFTAFVLLTPLAVTSTRGWIRRLGKRWTKLHRLVYVAAALGVLHYYWQVKADTLWAWIAAGVLMTLLAARARRRAGGRDRAAQARRAPRAPGGARIAGRPAQTSGHVSRPEALAEGVEVPATSP